MTQTQHTTRSCSSSSSSNDLQHAHQRRRRQMSTQLLTLFLLLLISCSAAATAQSRFFYNSADAQGKVRTQRQTSVDAAATVAADETAEATSCCQGAAAASVEPVTLSLDLSNVTADYGETEGSGESSKENFKRSVARAAVRNAPPASCSPQPTIVELKPPTDGQGGEQSGGGNVYYSPACTRINRCNGCCGSTLISCQATETETLQLRVRKVERSGASSKRGYAIVTVEQHLACKCDCRIKAEDCNTYQEYRKDLCRCECQNTDARDKCLEQSDHKYWDDANCTCACRYNQSCTTGTVFDETQCKCTDPSTPRDIADRRRFIVQAVAVEPDNSTLYSV
ncbi:vascular endothelial growth factor C [Drosophila innubila]|uniref:vascular endothelial growth factor C n=1 Tax=Drosophila innubila TaxID=198719 RepID=UPI00148E74A5|nr:vascular endothelial growth factor C [Drosophila innubila]